MGHVTLIKNQYRLGQWAKLIQKYQSSGMKVDDWCEANGITHHAYYYWLRKVRKASCLNLPAVDNPKDITMFKRLKVQSPAVGIQAAVIIHLPIVTLKIQKKTSQ